MPRGLRADFMHLYWFCRTADDLADAHDGSEPARSRAADALRSLRASLHHAVAQTPPDATPAPTPASTGEPAQPLAALARTIRTRLLPLEPFDALIDAFLQDQVRTRYDRWDELLQYSAGSADPVGRLVLRLLHAHTPFDLAAADRLSDRVCTALQLANFWQDVRRDLVERNRVYLPGETGVTPDHVRRWLDTPDDPEAQRVVGAAILTLSGRTRAMLDEGRPLVAALPRQHRPLIRLFIAGGDAILDAINATRGRTLWSRPTVSRWLRAGLLARESWRRTIGV